MNLIFEFQTLGDYLKYFFNKKKERNTQYSMRAYARDLNIDVGNLSKILKNQKEIGLNTLINIKNHFNLNNDEFLYLISISSELKLSKEVYSLYELCGLGFGMNPIENKENQIYFHNLK